MGQEFPPQSVARLERYAACDAAGYSASASAYTEFSSASVTFATTETNTEWLVTVSADVSAPTGYGAVTFIRLSGTVDSVHSWTDGVARVQASYADDPDLRKTITGRLVVTLASAASHTVTASAYVAGNTWTVGPVTISVEQLS